MRVHACVGARVCFGVKYTPKYRRETTTQLYIFTERRREGWENVDDSFCTSIESFFQL